MVREQQGKFICTDCGHTYSSMLGDDEVPEVCEQCDEDAE
jgi:rubrerythrin|tara:strand:- start:495 stop:614 length:120 start_codon:yes stop_codon:yes gene_type:complete